MQEEREKRAMEAITMADTRRAPETWKNLYFSIIEALLDENSAPEPETEYQHGVDISRWLDNVNTMLTHSRKVWRPGAARGRFQPLTMSNWIPEALKISGFSRADCMNFEIPDMDPGEHCRRADVHRRRTAHTQNPLDDLSGNAQALPALCEEYGLSITLR
jgi:hypothetical protein